jgi:probable nitrogen fixation protein
MTADVPITEAPDTALLEAPFLKTLVRVIRAHDPHGAWDNQPDRALLERFVVTKEMRKQIPILGDPDPRTLLRLDQYYAAVALAIEGRTGLIAQPLIKLSHEGWGRVVLIAGRLVVLSRSLRDVHRFGFLSLAKLIEDAEKLVAQGVAAIEEFPDAAKA